MMQNSVRGGMKVEELSPSAILVCLHVQDDRNVVPNIGNNKCRMKIRFDRRRRRWRHWLVHVVLRALGAGALAAGSGHWARGHWLRGAALGDAAGKRRPAVAAEGG